MLNNVHWCVLLIFTLILTWLPNTEAALLKYPLIDLFPGDYGSRCNKTGVETDSTELFSSCNSQLICHRSTCVCPVGHIFQRKLFISSARCVRFEKAICGSDKICQDVDSNVICRNRRCQCPTDYQFGSNGLCQKITQKKSDNHDIRRCQTYCDDNNPCTGVRTHCHQNQCECSPDYEFLMQNSNHDHLAKQDDECACVRKICLKDYECQSGTNPNLICHNKLCECRIGYGMVNRTCTKLLSRKQSCDTVCKIIGGLFASIFILTLVYWCCYCCYSIARNYGSTNRQFIYNSDAFLSDIDSHHSFHFDSHRNQHHTGSYFSLNRLQTFFPLSDDPPTYSQVMADERLPNYDSVMELKTINNNEHISEQTLAQQQNLIEKQST